ncbi:hypothetical protein G647_04248 [Cladophialophora carrionii CBS 160.54]|uniref:Gamma-glutamylcyclotransferase AIG2-like domain-containing protein n=1 Tax=Cladophialophora carrionii CBS 160.54 TaxID=1279043 RepID=V9DEY4_9EURO|nr:uncharacterized protein G647_04248 [Cladophialophora carrionii CBS 160.54]ETI24878.1 hypothetical protein G647_04248 [Cladophialophora carrionii CBS 160.54]
MPATAAGVGESGACTSFCELDGRAQANLLAWISEHHAGFHPTIVRLAKASKDLCAHSLAPTLSVDATLPQNRLPNNDTGTTFLPAQDQYPVWYFFYGTLGDSHVLTRHLGIERGRTNPRAPREWPAPDLGREVQGPRRYV